MSLPLRKDRRREAMAETGQHNWETQQMSGHGWIQPCRAAEEEQALNYRPPPLCHPAPQHGHSRGNGKDETSEKGFHFKTPGLWKEQRVHFFSNASTCPLLASLLDHKPALPAGYFQICAHLFPPAVCSWQKAPALFGLKKGTGE